MKPKRHKTLFAIFFAFCLVFLSFHPAGAQTKKASLPENESDSTEIKTDSSLTSVKKEHSPSKASIMSAALPGLGQVYNKKYWKVPIVYAFLGTAVYFSVQQNNTYQDWKQAYIYRIDEDPETSITEIDGQSIRGFSNDFLLQQAEVLRRNRDLMYVGTAILYLLNIVDAAVDAHMYNFNVSDDLSLHFRPDFKYSVNTNTFAQGISLTLNW